MSPAKQQQVELVCYGTVSNMFAMMLNPKYRGENFTWETFPNTMAELSAAQAQVLVSQCTNEMTAHARKFGRQLARKLVSRMQE